MGPRGERRGERRLGMIRRPAMPGRRPVLEALPLTALVSARARRVLVAALAAFLSGYLVYVAYVALGLVQHPLPKLVLGDWLFYGLLGSTALICLARGWTLRPGRGPWLVLGVGMACWTAGMVYWGLFLRDLETPPFPSLADALYLSLYPATYVTLGLLARDRLEQFGRSMWLDGLVGGLATVAIGAAVVLPPTFDTTGASTAAVAVNLAYPLGDLLLLAFLVGLYALTGWAPGRALGLMGLGLAVFTLADTVYLHQVASETFAEGRFLDTLWPAGLLLLALAAWQPVPRRRPARIGTWGMVLFPLAFTVTSLGVVVYGAFQAINAIALGAAAAALLLASVRTGLTLVEVGKLLETQAEARTDELTGLANRRFFNSRAGAVLAESDAAGRSAALLLADLDGFKDLNDTLGHHAGDLLLKEVGVRMRQVGEPEHLLGRLGGDEFAILAPGVANADALALAARVQAALERPFAIEDILVHVEASIGIAVSPEHGRDSHALLQHADVAMYEAKVRRTGAALYSRSRNRHSRERLGLLGELSRAVEGAELEVHYQPKHRLVDGTIAGVEALMRWRHPHRGLLMPSAFLPASQRTALMRPLTLLVLERALEECARWREPAERLSVSVNVSPTALLDSHLPADIARLAREADLAPGDLVLEVTEDAVMAEPSRTALVLEELRYLGVEISLDDFGTGQSSLSHLKWLSLDEVKIDRSFVMAMPENPKDETIVETAIELGHRLGMRVVAEGVEKAYSLDRLREFACDLAQGYHLSRPMRLSELADFLSTQAPDAGVASIRPATNKSPS
jgi:diguanylate cyclase